MTGTMLAACAALLLRAPDPAARFCDCASPPNEADAVRRSAVVFRGRPVRSRMVYHGDGHATRLFTFTVTRVRKGAPRRTVQVETGLGGGDCGVDFHRGRSYVVYARRDANGRLTTDICAAPYSPVPEPPARRDDR